MVSLEKILNVQVGVLTLIQLGLIYTAVVFGILVNHAFADDDDCVVGFDEVSATTLETVQIVLLSLAGVLLLVMTVTRFRQEKFFSSENEDKYQYPMMFTAAVLIGISFAVALIVAFTGACKSSKHTKVEHIEIFAWTTLSMLCVNMFLSVSANLAPMKSGSEARDMIGWSSLGSIHILRIVFLATLVYVLRDSTLYERSGTHENTDNNEINVNHPYGGILTSQCHAHLENTTPRGFLDKFTLLSFFDEMISHDAVNTTTTVAPTTSATNSSNSSAALLFALTNTTNSTAAPNTTGADTNLPLHFKVSTYDGMVAAVWTGLVMSILSSFTIGVALKFRDNFSVSTINVPGVLEKTFQVGADVVVAICITSLILENEISTCQVWNLDNTAVQCMFVSAAILVYCYTVAIFVNTVRRIDGFGLTKEGQWWSYSNLAYGGYM